MKTQIQVWRTFCELHQNFVLRNHSVGGGTGSGMGMLILERLAVDFRKKSKGKAFFCFSWTCFFLCEYPSHTDVSQVLDNKALWHLSKVSSFCPGIVLSSFKSVCFFRKLDIKKPSYSNLNRVVAKVNSSMTGVDMNKFQTNLVPFPRLQLMTTSLAPGISKAN